METLDFDSPLEEQIETLNDEWFQYSLNNDQLNCQRVLDQIWDLIPEPKTKWKRSYNFITYYIKGYLRQGKPENALKWTKELFEYGLDRHDSGEREFLSGKVHYALGNTEQARNFFKVAHEK
ncbi:MAG: hypothetical protein MRY83_09360, partial [Flavobacteriales bacterium]|nr:hypothetical protein [Flavobacteriales bacterium]